MDVNPQARQGRRGAAIALGLAFILILAGCETTERRSVFDLPKRPASDDGKYRPFGSYASLPDPSGPAPAESGIVVRGSGDLMGNARPRRAAFADSGPERRDGQTYTLNLVDASVAEAAKAVLGDIYGVNYTIDGKIDARITVQTAKPATREEIGDLFVASLRASGAAIVQNGSFYRVVPADQAAAGARVGQNGSGGSLGTTVRVVPMRFVAAAEMKRILEPVAPSPGVVQVDQARNALILTGTEQEIGSLEETIGVFDVNVMRGMSFALVPVRSSEPDALVEELNSVFSANKEGPMNGMVQFIANKRSKSVLVMSRQPQYLTDAQQWVRRLDDRAAGGARQFYTYPLRNRQAKELVEVLNAIFANETATGPGLGQDFAPATRAPISDIPPPAAAAAQTTVATTTGPAPVGPSFASFGGAITQTTTTAPGLPDPMLNGAANGTARTEFGAGPNGPRIKIVADQSQNALLVLASAADYKRVERVVANLDVVPNQVLIEATIAEVTLNDDLKFGVRWFFEGQNGKHTGVFSNALSGALGSVFPGFSYVFKTAATQVTLNALNEVATVNVLASPSLMVLDGKTATLQIGDQVPITTQSAVSVLTPGAPVVNSIAYKDTGVILSVTPKVNEAGRVLLDIEQEVSSVSRTLSSNIDSPTFGRRRVKTTVIVNNAEGITLGGLIQDRTTERATQVPVLGDIPILGNAFKDKGHAVEKTELLIMLTPRVVRDLNEAQAVTDEYRAKVESFAPRPKSPAQKIKQNVVRTLQ